MEVVLVQPVGVAPLPLLVDEAKETGEEFGVVRLEQ